MRTPITILLSVALAAPSHAAAQSAVGYQITYAGGSLPNVKPGSGLRLFIDGPNLRLVSHSNEIFSLPSKSITELTYGQEIHRRIGTAAAVAVVSLGVGAIVAFSKSKKHYIGLSWNDAGNSGGLVFQAGKDEYRGLLLALEAVSGKRVSEGDGSAGVQTMQGSSSNAGIFTFASVPSGAEVFLDNTSVGATPTRGVQIPTGPHTLAVRKPGYQEWVRQVTIEPGEQHAVTAELKVEAPNGAK